MKGDFTRDTFDQAKHFSRVLSQQGRVTLDADFNEQSAIDLHYLRTLARDVIGPYAAPVNPFRVLEPTVPNAEGGFLVQEHTSADGFKISAGRYYVDGILVENDRDCTYITQPDYTPPGTDPLLQAIQKNGPYTQFGIYLDVWERHITAIEDDSICEKALDGRDTCTRAKVVWQVKGWPLTPTQQAAMSKWEQDAIKAEQQAVANKAQAEKDFQAAAAAKPPDPTVLLRIFSQQLQPADDELAQLWRFSRLQVHKAVLDGLPPRISNASLAARVNPVQQKEDPCVTPPTSKYRGAENQLYRVEIHQGGPPLDAVKNAATTTLAAAQSVSSAVSGATVVSGAKQAADTASTNIQNDTNKTAEEKAAAKAVADAVDAAAAAAGATPPPTFKWSRDNGSVATAWLSVNGNDLKVASTRGFAAGNWVELSDDNSEKVSQPGTLLQLVKVDGDVLSVDPAMTVPPITNFPKHPKIRRWDYIATEAIPLAKDNAIPIQESPVGAIGDQIVWIDLEDGVQVQFSANGVYRTGDYWLIPARVATGNVEWPLDSSSNPQLLPPHGIEHHYALLCLLDWEKSGVGSFPIFYNDRFEFWPLSFNRSHFIPD
jgi:hypothetical protein